MLQQNSVKHRWLFEVREVPRAVNQFELRTGNEGVHGGGDFRRGGRVLHAVDNERRAGDLGQHFCRVFAFGDGPHCFADLLRVLSHNACSGFLDELLVRSVGLLREEVRQHPRRRRLGSFLHYRFPKLLPHGEGLRRVGVGARVAEHQQFCQLRVEPVEGHRLIAAHREADDGRALPAKRFHEAGEVVRVIIHAPAGA